MPVKRRVSKQWQHRITPEAVAAFIAEDEVALTAALKLRPWEVSPLGDPSLINVVPGTAYAGSRDQAIELRAALQEASRKGN